MRDLLLRQPDDGTGHARAPRLRRIGPEGLPASLDALLAPPETDLAASRLWYDTTCRVALPPGTQAMLAEVGPPGTMVVPLLMQDGRIESLTTPYTLRWRPLTAAWAGAVALERAAAELGELLRGRPPTLFRAMDSDDTLLLPLQAGLWRAGLWSRPFAHFGNWHEALPPGLRWADYVAAREQPMRSTLMRRRRRWEDETRIDLLTEPGAALEKGIAAYIDVRARSWKAAEPSPAFDPALMRGAAAAGLLRLGVLRSRADGRPLAAQYWVVSGGQAALLKLVHDEAARTLSPGTGLTAAMVAALIAEGVAGIDLGRGDDGYKRFWAKSRRQRIGMLIADPRHPAGMLALARHAAGRGWHRLRGIVARGETGEGPA
ncbi:GNAT family N-acetyltransferase [Roseomonas terrae]|uniref:GNAT family N-acetyltransferase n=1 Tax=Neoroseomonas terrae TaxID=424799 RepID=A0ABS5EJ55_9PROT|nr:GNAT family N-acetyltransferase [Neoroseomonas terrae]MBR0651038.1 GNAT family N-acetyltransferase [Neoroseomonas terrae]